MKKNYTVFLLLFIVYYTAFSQGTWTPKLNFGGGMRYIAVGFSIGAKGYIGTGYGSSGMQHDFWEWDPSTNVWTQKADFGGAARYFATGFSIGTKGYIGTGYGSSGILEDFWEWNQSTNAWTQKADFGAGERYYATGFSIGTKGYIGTGNNYNGMQQDFWEWNQSTNVWTQKADFTGGVRYLAVGFSIGTKGYIGTGFGSSGYEQDFWEWNQSSNTWTQKLNFPGAARYMGVGFSIGTKGYIGTGNSTIGVQQDFWEWDPSTNVWVQKASVGGVERYLSIGFSIGTKGYIGTGYGSSSMMQDFREYDPIDVLPIGILSFTASVEENRVAINWSTASEINNDYFTIERSPDANNFEPIGNVKGAGNSNNTLFYSFVDMNVHDDINYYRLKQTDYDGKSTYSETVTAEMKNNFGFTVFPNPAIDKIIIAVNNKISRGTIQLFNVFGGNVFEETIDNSATKEINLKNISHGIYFVKVSNEEKSSIQKLIVE
ncbi:MAG TPA: T9SS type A sorting domain-containing protein [Chitinophagales bacterium]|nr:T9SS type A sorting domain-containing protein [Chitinophagales bacterium]